MRCKALLYTVNTTAQTLAIGNTLALGNAARRRASKCCDAPNINLSGSSVVLSNGDYYSIDANVVVTPTAAGTVVINMVQDGTVVASASATVAAAATTVTLPLSAIVRTRCGTSNISLQLAGAAATVNQVYLTAVEED